MNEITIYNPPLELHAANSETGVLKRFIDQSIDIKNYLLNHPDRKLAFFEVCSQTDLGKLLILNCYNKINWKDLENE